MRNALVIAAIAVAALGLLIATHDIAPMPCVRLGNMPIAGACH